MSTIYEQLRENESNPATVLDTLIGHLRSQRRATELFEAIKMRTRLSLGLPLVIVEEEPKHSVDVERQLESGLLEACREAGVMLLEDGHVGQGWMYLRPTGDMETAQKLAAKVESTDENHEELIQVLLQEGVDIQRGFEIMLKHQGTCSSITNYQQSMPQRSRSDRQQAANALLDHFYAELSQAVRDDICRREAPAGDDETLLEMIEKRADLMSQGGYHLDTTHVASVVQISTVIDDPDRIQKAYELTQYGRRLHHTLQYPGEEPYKDFYPAHLAFYSALLGKNTDASLEYFRHKAELLDPMQHGTGPIETYVDLLSRTGQKRRAIEAATQLVPDGVPPQRIIPMLMQLIASVSAEELEPAKSAIAEYCQRRGDLLGYTAAITVTA